MTTYGKYLYSESLWKTTTQKFLHSQITDLIFTISNLSIEEKLCSVKFFYSRKKQQRSGFAKIFIHKNVSIPRKMILDSHTTKQIRLVCSVGHFLYRQLYETYSDSTFLPVGLFPILIFSKSKLTSNMLSTNQT